ncbi:MAG: type I-E CRISPR-associated endoribonuclease Cas2 [Deltaproteobacteria bacterium]|nr:type I-E CRISPR-associated endoribonuclease Cas2 [Deltaproteobacteria bacterium]
MSMTVVVTRNVPERFRGFLASCMLEVAPGVYTAPHMTKGVRERAWAVCEEWFAEVGPDGCLVMTYVDANQPSGQAVRTLGVAPRQLVELDGAWLARRDIPSDDVPF